MLRNVSIIILGIEENNGVKMIEIPWFDLEIDDIVDIDNIMYICTLYFIHSTQLNDLGSQLQYIQKYTLYVHRN